MPIRRGSTTDHRLKTANRSQTAFSQCVDTNLRQLSRYDGSKSRVTTSQPEIPGPEPDIIRLVEALDQAGVDYIVIGGMACVLHGSTTTTRDCDIVIDQDYMNLMRLMEALTALNWRDRSATSSADDAKARQVAAGRGPKRQPAELQDAFLNVQTDAGPLDVLPTMPVSDDLRIDYRVLNRFAVYVDITGTNTTVKVASIDHLIASKTTIDRPHDREAVAELRRIQREARSPRRKPQ